MATIAFWRRLKVAAGCFLFLGEIESGSPLAALRVHDRALNASQSIVLPLAEVAVLRGGNREVESFVIPLACGYGLNDFASTPFSD